MWYLVLLVSWVAMDTEEAGLESRGGYIPHQHVSMVALGLHTLPSESVELADEGDSGRMPPVARVMNGDSSMTEPSLLEDPNQAYVSTCSVVVVEEFEYRLRLTVTRL